MFFKEFKKEVHEKLVNQSALVQNELTAMKNEIATQKELILECHNIIGELKKMYADKGIRARRTNPVKEIETKVVNVEEQK